LNAFSENQPTLGLIILFGSKLPDRLPLKAAKPAEFKGKLRLNGSGFLACTIFKNSPRKAAELATIMQ